MAEGWRAISQTTQASWLAWPAMAPFALAAGFGFLVVFRLAARPSTIGRLKGRFVAHVLELALFRDDVVVTLRALAGALAANLRYMRVLLVPSLAGSLPMLIMCVTASLWLDARPLRPGEAAILTVRLKEQAQPLSDYTPWLATSPNLKVETPALRMADTREIDWRIRATGTGPAWIDVCLGPERLRRRVAVGHARPPVPRTRASLQSLSWFTHPTARPLPARSLVGEIAVGYPSRVFPVGHVELNWLVAFLILTALVIVLLKRPMGVRW